MNTEIKRRTVVDHATQISLRLKQYASVLAAAGTKHTDDYSVEQWLGFWDEDDSTFGNVRNLEHWLSQAARQASKRGVKASA
jgi:hypothetical protein